MKPKYLLAALAAAALVLAGCDQAGQKKQTENRDRTGDKQAENKPAPGAPMMPTPEPKREVAQPAQPPELKPPEQPAVAEKATPTKDTEQFMLSVNQKLDELDKGISALGDTIESLNDNAEANETLRVLREHREQVQHRFDDLKKANQDGWNELKTNFESALNDLEKAFREANTQYRG